MIFGGPVRGPLAGNAHPPRLPRIQLLPFTVGRPACHIPRGGKNWLVGLGLIPGANHQVGLWQRIDHLASGRRRRDGQVTRLVCRRSDKGGPDQELAVTGVENTPAFMLH